MNYKFPHVAISLLALFVLGYAAAPRVAAQQPEAPVLRVAFVNSQKLADPQLGPKRLVAAWKALETEFAPTRTQLNELQTRIDALVKTYETTKSTATQIRLNELADQISAMQRELKLKQEAAQTDYSRRYQVVVTPVMQDVGKKLEAFARARKIDAVLDFAKLSEAGAILTLEPKGDITDAFIAYVDAQP